MKSDRHDVRDRGSVLPLVLVMLVVGSLIVIPTMSYAVSVFKANRVVSERAKDVEAAKAGLRVALADTINVFNECDDGGTLPTVTVNGRAVSTTCSEISEVGAAEALGGQVPYNAAALQIGASIPEDFAYADGDSLSYPNAVPPYPDAPPVECATDPAEFWYCADIGFNTDPGVNGGAPTPISNSLWLPDLPEWPDIERPASEVPWDMPPGFNCQVYLPGYYPDPITVSTGEVYFASGVYYFADTVTITGDADVVVGYGLADFGTECADDIQVATNLLDPPALYGISGAGATWVFGDMGRLVVVDDGANSPRLRFNQRYVPEGESGGRISIMSVNGVVDPADPTAAGYRDHTVTHVNHVPLSQELTGVTAGPLSDGEYVPSDPTFTDLARAPERLDPITVTTFTDPDTGLGVAQIEWDELLGNDLGGSLLGVLESDGSWSTVPYQVQVRPREFGADPVNWLAGNTTICQPDEIVVVDGGVGNPDRLQCTVGGLDPDPTIEYRFRVRPWAVDAYGNDLQPQFRNSATTIDSVIVAEPDAPANVVVGPTDSADEAVIRWDIPDSDIVIDDYTVTATAITQQTPPDEGPIAEDAGTTVTAGDPVATLQLPVSDPNGAPLSVTIDDTALRSVDPTASVVAVGSTAEIRTSALTPTDTYTLPYTVDDGTSTNSGDIVIEVEAAGQLAGESVAYTLPSTVDPPTSVTLDDVALTGADPLATVVVTGLDVVIQTTTATPVGVYDLPYVVTSGSETITGIVRLVVEATATIAPGETLSVLTAPPAVPPAVAPLTLSIDGSSLPAGTSAATVGDVVEIITTATTPDGSYSLPYEFRDSALPTPLVVPGSIDFTVSGGAVSATPNPPAAWDARALAEVGVPIVVEVPATHPDRDTLTLAVDSDPLLAADSAASLTVSGLAVTVSTVAPDGSYLLPFTVTDSFAQVASGTLTVVIDRTETDAGTCQPLREDFVPIEPTCTIDGLTPIPTVAGGGLGYQFEVVATSKAGDSVPSVTAAPFPGSFDGSGSAFVGPSPLARIVTPYMPEAIIDIDASGTGTMNVAIAGYVSVPMGRILVDNPDGESIGMIGGVLAGTFDVTDGRGDGTRNSVPIGYFNDIVLQRTVRIVSVAGDRRSTAIVQVNEDGGDPGILSWFIS